MVRRLTSYSKMQYRIRFPCALRGVTSEGRSFGPSAVRTVMAAPVAASSTRLGDEAPLAAALLDHELKAATEPELAKTLLWSSSWKRDWERRLLARKLGCGANPFAVRSMP